jgi:hypothetical protein
MKMADEKKNSFFKFTKEIENNTKEEEKKKPKAAFGKSQTETPSSKSTIWEKRKPTPISDGDKAQGLRRSKSDNAKNEKPAKWISGKSPAKTTLSTPNNITSTLQLTQNDPPLLQSSPREKIADKEDEASILTTSTLNCSATTPQLMGNNPYIMLLSEKSSPEKRLLFMLTEYLLSDKFKLMQIESFLLIIRTNLASIIKFNTQKITKNDLSSLQLFQETMENNDARSIFLSFAHKGYIDKLCTLLKNICGKKDQPLFENIKDNIQRIRIRYREKMEGELKTCSDESLSKAVTLTTNIILKSIEKQAAANDNNIPSPIKPQHT